MGRKCAGGQLDGMAVFTDEDVHSCELGGGRVVSDGNTGGCGASNIAAMAVPAKSRGSLVPPDQALASLRRIRASGREHPAVQAALTLNALAAAEIGRIGQQDAALKVELAAALQTVAGICEAVASGKRSDEKLTKRVHAQLADLAERVIERTDDSALKTGLAFFLSLTERMVGRTFGEIAKEVIPTPAHSAMKPPSESVTLNSRFPSAAIVSAANQTRFSPVYSDVFVVKQFPGIAQIIRDEIKAKSEIDAKARALGTWIGNQVGDLEDVTGGFRQVYEYADLYVGADGIVHEVHGDIRRKYDFLHGPDGPLGLPVTDETGTPDGIGRFNHFEHNGSIYWTPTTGPMMVRGVIRQLWSSQGWETGPLGYPVADEYRLPGIFPPNKPNLAWSLFQNGTLLSQGNAVARAPSADIQPDALRSLVRSFFDQRLHAAGQDLGLEAQVDVVEITGWGYGFLASVPRRVTYRLHGFHENPLIADTTFEITVGLRFAATWSMSFTYPTTMTLFVALDGLAVHADGAFAGTIANGIFDGINGAFNRGAPDPDHPEVPNGGIFIASFPTGVDQRGLGKIDVINTLTTAQGGLQVLVNPLPTSFGGLRRTIAQSQVDAFLQSF